MIPTIRGADLYGMHDAERCCFCWASTRFVTHIPKREPRAQVPCCEPCSRSHSAAQVPGLRAYCDLADALSEAEYRRLSLEVRKAPL